MLEDNVPNDLGYRYKNTTWFRYDIDSSSNQTYEKPEKKFYHTGSPPSSDYSERPCTIIFLWDFVLFLGGKFFYFFLYIPYEGGVTVNK